jgi:hypothetical protein
MVYKPCSNRTSGATSLNWIFSLFYVTSKSDNFNWVMIAVYGAARDEKKPEFLSEYDCLDLGRKIYWQ